MKLDQVQHAIDGTVSACKELVKLVEEKEKQASLPSRTQIIHKLHAVEKATYNNLAQVGTWLQEIIKVMKE
tara:strand:- start:3613 stop:3825 length:213 start_codon:yes stop_codon:yes gene_type:complete